jgi:hypothetical protein
MELLLNAFNGVFQITNNQEECSLSAKCQTSNIISPLDLLNRERESKINLKLPAQIKELGNPRNYCRLKGSEFISTQL